LAAVQVASSATILLHGSAAGLSIARQN